MDRHRIVGIDVVPGTEQVPLHGQLIELGTVVSRFLDTGTGDHHTGIFIVACGKNEEAANLVSLEDPNVRFTAANCTIEPDDILSRLTLCYVEAEPINPDAE